MSWLETFFGSQAQWRDLAPLGAFGISVWALWLYRVIGSRFCKPIVNDFTTSTSVVVPSYREDPRILQDCARNWLSQDPGELIVVVDVADEECQRLLAEIDDPRLQVIVYRHEGKRSALGVGIRAARNEVVVLADSDTMWTDGLLRNVQMPFADPMVGAVSTQQNVYQRTSSVWRRIADWMVNLRYYDYVPVMGRRGAVACVSGRTAAYRRSVVMPVLPNLEHEFFLGRRCIAGDDGRLTWLVLASGYKTVHQSSARAISMFPDSFRAFVKQRVRWSRNSARTYLTALWKGWLWKMPVITIVTVLQILLTPVTMGMTLAYLVFSRLELTPAGFALAAAWLLVGRGIRSFSHLRRHPQEILLLPLYALVVILVALPIKAYAIVTMNKQGWLTRTADSTGGEGQSAATLTDPAPVPAPISIPNPAPAGDASLEAV
ncbi:cellulose synthase/poly-beta-1,6-N-acetylglucosamine synthase-like glycosyltransferase [Kineococcus xinjiangensis]|uniref:Cellulose synthase/poly-beta-1,6-N-acetylglucosamine synthase-like glycosyltransferase n=1 Tax=Kineococcus xinjiangensis TaxID=512762 RepID=A0A2S6ICQ5_9ACTN|nr:glycosyltransferase [Kineococcus xinjiangensis]PPK91977.1 cellulose synthase/poly-beta-1,6-N-acetylglucosamine synthase-like glycosyltransferase [Kineococcus xinjiangensis]